MSPLGTHRRLVAIVYCLTVVYCLVWVPWVVHPADVDRGFRLGYGFLWAGPDSKHVAVQFSSPDYSLVLLRLIAVTALFSAVWLVLPARPQR